MIIKSFYKDNIVSIYYSIFLILIIYLTNEFSFSYEYNNAASSSFYYLEIAKNFPNTPEFQNNIQSYIHSERFFISYMVGLFSYLTNLEIYKTFFLLNFFTIFFITILFIQLLSNFKISFINKITLINLFALNPYTFRYFIQNPVMLNDLIFLLGILLFVQYLSNNKNILFYLSIFLLVFSRQTFIIFFVSLFLTFVIKKSKFINYKKIIFIILIFVIYLFFSKIFIHNAQLDQNYKISITGLYFYLKDNYFTIDFIIFISLPIISLGPVLILMIFELLRKNLNKISLSDNFFLILVIVGFFSQPILAGPEIAGRNILRLAFFSYVPLIFLFLKHHKDLIKKNYILIYFNIIIIFWSFHPNFSKIKIFDFLRFSKDFIIF